jgi:hypothetical protein
MVKRQIIQRFHRNMLDLAEKYKAGYISQFEAIRAAQLEAVKSQLEIAAARNLDGRAAAALAELALRPARVNVSRETDEINDAVNSYLSAGKFSTRQSRGAEIQQALRTSQNEQRLQFRVFRKIDNLIKTEWDDVGLNLGLDDVVQYNQAQLETLGSWRSFAEANGTLNARADAKKWIYYGPENSRNRDFCAEHVGKIYTEEEINALDRQDWQGKSGSIWTDCGGWNCVHALVPWE